MAGNTTRIIQVQCNSTILLRHIHPDATNRIQPKGQRRPSDVLPPGAPPRPQQVPPGWGPSAPPSGMAGAPPVPPVQMSPAIVLPPTSVQQEPSQALVGAVN